MPVELVGSGFGDGIVGAEVLGVQFEALREIRSEWTPIIGDLAGSQALPLPATAVRRRDLTKEGLHGDFVDIGCCCGRAHIARL